MSTVIYRNTNVGTLLAIAADLVSRGVVVSVVRVPEEWGEAPWLEAHTTYGEIMEAWRRTKARGAHSDVLLSEVES